MNIVILCGSYAPSPSAVGICAKNVAEELSRQEHHVTVICERSSTSVRNIVETVGNITIRRISTDTLDLLFGNKFQFNLYRVIRYLQSFLFKENIAGDIVSAYKHALAECNKAQPIDLILPFCFPYESIVAAIDFKKDLDNKVRVAPLVFDNFVENKTLHRTGFNMRLKRRRHLKLMKYNIASADMNYICHSQRDFVDKELFMFKNKIKLIEHPLLLSPKHTTNSGETLLYSGAFLRNYVKSGDFSRVMEMVLQKTAFPIEFCVMGNDLKPILRLTHKFPQRVHNNGKVPFETAALKIAKAGVLLSVGEINGIQISSKIFTYMATGKPIIHFYYSETDVNKRILEKYPLSYSFDLNEVNDINVSSMCDFIQHNCMKSISFDEVACIYKEAIPKTLVDNILSELA